MAINCTLIEQTVSNATSVTSAAVGVNTGVLYVFGAISVGSNWGAQGVSLTTSGSATLTPLTPSTIYGTRRAGRLWRVTGFGTSDTFTVAEDGGSLGDQSAGICIVQATGLDATTPDSGVVTDTDTASTTHSATTSTTPDTGDATLSFTTHEVNEACTTEAGWVELSDSGETAGVRRMVSAWDSDADTACTFTFGSNGSSFTVTLTLEKAAGSSFTGSSAVTLAGVTSAATGAYTPPPITGSSAVTLADVTSAATGAYTPPPITGSSAVTLEDVTSAASGTFGNNYTGSSAVTLEDVTSAATGAYTPPPITGSSAVTLEDVTSAASGTFTGSGRTGSSAVTLEDVTSVATGSVTLAHVDVMVGRDIAYGFAEQQGITGGQGQTVHTVTSTADSGAGTLRDALSAGNRYINFDPSIYNSTITLTSTLTISGSNITIDAVAAGITITQEGLRFTGTNFVVAGLTFLDNDGTASTDAVTVRDATTTQIGGFYFCTFSTVGNPGANDGLLDIIWHGDQNVYITIAGCKFSNHDKTLLINSGSSNPTLEGSGGAYYVTTSQCWFDLIKQRTPLARDAHVHLVNQIVTQYGDGAAARMGSNVNPPGGFTPGMWAENCMVQPGVDNYTMWDGVTTDPSPRTDWFSNGGSGSAMKATGTHLKVGGDNTPTETEHLPGNVFTPPYSSYVADADDGLMSFLQGAIGAANAIKTPLDAPGTVNPAASFAFIANGDSITVLTEDVGSSVTAVELFLDATSLGTMTESPAGTWTRTLSGLPAVGTSGDLKAVATTAAGNVDSPLYPSMVIAATGPVGSSAVTLEDVTSAASGTFILPPRTGSSAVTLDPVTSVATGAYTQPGPEGSAAVTLDPVTCVATGSYSVGARTGSCAVTLGDVACSAAGVVPRQHTKGATGYLPPTRRRERRALFDVTRRVSDLESP